jgi:hypothetical protein
MLSESEGGHDLERISEYYEKFDSTNGENLILKRIKLLWCPTLSAFLLTCAIIGLVILSLVTFYTIPKKTSFTLLYVGDWGINSKEQTNVAKLMRFEFLSFNQKK